MSDQPIVPEPPLERGAASMEVTPEQWRADVDARTKPEPRILRIRRRADGEVAEEMDVSHLTSTTNFNRFYDGLLMKVDFERFYIEDSAAEGDDDERG